jgi:hypothetical protein
MFQFKNISLKRILVFSEIINSSSLLKTEFIKTRYLKSATDYDEIFSFLKELGLVKTRKTQIVLNPKYKVFLKMLKNLQWKQQMVQEFFINNLILKTNSFSGYLNEFFSHFHCKDGRYKLKPSTSQRLRYSGLRNFLMELEFLYLDSKNKEYIISDIYPIAYTELRDTKKLSVDEFKQVMQRKAQIGYDAEIQIIEYEKERLSNFPFLVEKIDHTSIKDVMAGYDILSWEADQQEGKAVPRHIEVKGVSMTDSRFYWSRNEIEKAKELTGRYYLYLLPVIGNKVFDMDGLKIIPNPIVGVFDNSKSWDRQVETYLFSKTGK